MREDIAVQVGARLQLNWGRKKSEKGGNALFFTMKLLSLIARSSPCPYGVTALASYLNERVPNDPIEIAFVHALPDKASAQLDIDGCGLLRTAGTTALTSSFAAS